ncbi:hypothetical protein L211DRAFT_897096 [Terfezia boudieri ATCC MYA-4762]|uniref:CCHC-type domain-containing protein n=1 Tax=Terfezia boudieri ATCC MYA-4762 TaxID=1051890 RepID=A0A3N4LWC9_9PEZI|nr:hypothetical protein L211DRAFT_897096 [Terfezia boudieri ATCC MYA-4762]
MAPPPKGVLFGPVKDWGKGASKVLLEFDGEDGGLVPEFGERGERAILQAIVNSQEVEKSWSGGGSWEHHISQLEKESREEEEVIKVVDGLSAERAIGILTRGVMIQDGSVNGLLEGFDFEYSQKEMEGGVEDMIVVKAKRPDGTTVEGFWGVTWTLTTPRSKKRGQMAGMPAERAEMEGIEEQEEGESENEAMNRRSARKGKGKGTEGRVSLKDLEEQAGLGFVEPAVPRAFTEVATNLFGQAPPAWKLDDSQGEWNKEDSMEEDAAESSAATGENKLEGEELRKWAEANPLTIKFTPSGKEKERREGREELNKSKHAVPELSVEQVEEMTREKVEGTGSEQKEAREEGEEDEEMEGEEEDGEEEEETRWNGIWDNREVKSILHCIVNNGKVVEQIARLKPKERSYRSARDMETARDQIRASGGVIEGNWWLDGDESGKGGWKDLSESALARGNMEFIKLVTAAERCWRENKGVKKGQLAGIERELAEVKKQLALLAVSLGAGTTNQVAQAKRTLNAQKGRVEEEKRKQEEVRKVDRQRKEAEARRREEEKNKEEAERLAAQSRSVKESQEKAREACEASIRELVGKDKSKMKAHKLIEVGQKLKEAEDMKRKVEQEMAAPVESSVGKTRQVVAGEVFKVVRVVMGHMQPIDAKGKKELEEAVGKVNNILRMKGLTEGVTPWTVMASAGKGEFGDESTWEVKKVKEGVDPLVVTGEVGKALVAVFGRTGDMLNVWLEDRSSVRLMVPAAPMKVARGRKGLGEAIQEENKEVKLAKRFPKLWGAARVTGFTFDVANNEEAKKVIRNGLVWEGQKRKVAYFEQKLPQQRTQQVTQKQGGFRHPLKPMERWSRVECHNCGGAGHMRRDCSSISRAAANKITRKEGPAGTAQRKSKIVDKEGFELVKRSKGKEGAMGQVGEEEEWVVGNEKGAMGIKSDWEADREGSAPGPSR